MDLDKKLNELIFRYEIDKPFPSYREIITDKGYIDYPTDDVINEGQYILEEAEGHLDLCHAIFEEREKGKRAETLQDAAVSIQRLIFMYTYIKDFYNVFRLLDLYCSRKYMEYDKYRKFGEELKSLFHAVTEAVKDRKGVINYWLDALDYGTEEVMPYLKEISKKCVYFENAYTFTNWTSFTLKNIITGKKTIDDKAYKISEISREAKLIKVLREHGMGFRYYGFHTYSMEEGLYSPRQFSRYQPSTLLLWEVIKDLAAEEQGMMYLVHFIAETHVPWLFPDIDTEYSKEEIYNTSLIPDNVYSKERRIQARRYVDEQLRFYDSILGGSVTRIYMSDHGDGRDGYECFSDACHTVLMVKDAWQRSLNIHSFFSYIDYCSLVRDILEKRQITEKIGGSYTIIQGVNYCDEQEICNRMCKERFSPDFLFGYRGVVTENDNYVLRADGYERYRRKGDEINYVNFSEYHDRIEELRKLAGTQFPDVFLEKEFISSRAVQQVMDRYRHRVGKEEIGQTMIKDYVNAVPERKSIAVRGNGKHTAALLSVLGDRYKRISCIADKNTDVPPVLGIPIILPEELRERKPDVVIISSLNYHAEFSKEVEELGIGCEIYDIYELLEERGIHLQQGFYEERYLDEDFEGITVQGEKV